MLARYRGSFFGLLWSFLTPLLLLGIYTFVFGVVFGARWPQGVSPGGLGDFALVVFCGLIVLNLFAECVSRAPGLVVGGAMALLGHAWFMKTRRGFADVL